MMKKIAVVAAVIIIVVGVGFLFKNNANKKSSSVGQKSTENIQTVSSVGELKTFQIDASNYKFSVNELHVKKGDRVKITLSVSQGFHDLVLNEFNAATEKVQAGNTTTVEFVADKAGKFEYYCSIGNHRQMGMVGTLFVE